MRITPWLQAVESPAVSYEEIRHWGAKTCIEDTVWSYRRIKRSSSVLMIIQPACDGIQR